VKTRWDSTYAFLKRLIEFRTLIGALSTNSYVATSKKTGQAKDLKLPSLDFDELQELVDALEPFAEYTKQLSSRKSSISEILPIFYSIQSMIKSDSSSHLGVKEQVQTTIAERLIDRMHEMKDDP